MGSKGKKKAREIWFLCRQYNAQKALEMGLVNTVVPLEKLEEETLKWSREMLQHSAIALRCIKSSLNAKSNFSRTHQYVLPFLNEKGH